jgi:hypothetical protein
MRYNDGDILLHKTKNEIVLVYFNNYLPWIVELIYSLHFSETTGLLCDEMFLKNNYVKIGELE